MPLVDEMENVNMERYNILKHTTFMQAGDGMVGGGQISPIFFLFTGPLKKFQRYSTCGECFEFAQSFV